MCICGSCRRVAWDCLVLVAKAAGGGIEVFSQQAPRLVLQWTGGRRIHAQGQAGELLFQSVVEFPGDALQTDGMPAAESPALSPSNGRSGWAGAVRHSSPQAPSPTLRDVACADVSDAPRMGRAARLARIAEDLAGTGQIRAAIEARVMAGTVAAAPPDTLAGRLLGLWRRTLRNPRIGFDDNFLDVGGTSLKAAQIAAEMRRELGQRVSIVTFFECPTVRAMAAWWRRLLGKWSFVNVAFGPMKTSSSSRVPSQSCTPHLTVTRSPTTTSFSMNT